MLDTRKDRKERSVARGRLLSTDPNQSISCSKNSGQYEENSEKKKGGDAASVAKKVQNERKGKIVLRSAYSALPLSHSASCLLMQKAGIREQK